MRNIKLMLFALAALALVAAGCDREITGDVERADNSSNNCFDCHDGADELGIEVVLATRQWENSKHASGDNIDRNSGSCRGCHTSEGFVARITGDDIAGDHYTAIGCFTCHDPHTNGDFELRITDAVALGNGATYDRGVSNLCVQCHKGRRNVETYVVDSVEMSNHFGPHHSNQSDMLLGENAYEYDSYDYDADSWHSAGVAEGCVKCHFRVSETYELGGHTFWVKTEDGEENTDACNVDGCHHNIEIDDFDRLAAEDFDGNGAIEGVQTEIEGLMEELEGLLIGAGLLEFIADEGVWEPTDDLVVPDADSAGAVFNWAFVHEDKSHGIHNTRYAVALLQSSINYMTTGDPNGSPAGQMSQFIRSH
ncbi:MAG: hypothetical protein ACYTF1_26830 [Planctomycetota bacterium]|jgi:hypothetical protein